jgi:methylenetetrahydrofolate--tRNA-(uracil-5-)-methyltransferase
MTTAMGALLNHITGGHISDDGDLAQGKPRSFQPMNINFGLFPDIEAPKELHGKRLRGKEKTRAKKQAMAARALSHFEEWLAQLNESIA